MVSNQCIDKKWQIALFCLSLILLLYVRDIFMVDYSKWILVVLCVGATVFFNRKNLIYILCFMFPLFCGLPRNYILLFYILALILKKQSINPKLLCFMLFWVFWELFSTFWVLEPNFVEVAGYCFHVTLMFYLIYDEEAMNYRKCIDAYLWGTLALCGDILLRTLITAPGNLLYLFSQGWFRFGMADDKTMGMVIQLNANSLAYYCVVGVSCALVGLLSSKSGKKIFYIISMAICGLLGLLTVSRSFLLVLFILVVMGIYFMPKRINTIIPVIAVFSVLAAGIGLIFISYPEILEGLMNRVQDSNVETAGERTVLFAKYLDAFLDDPRLLFTGTGVIYYKEITGIYNSMHNAIEQILVCFGIFGALAFISGLLIPVYRAIYKHKIGGVHWLPLITVVLFVQTIQFINPDMLMMPYVIGIYCLRIGSQFDEKVSNNS